MSHAIRAVGVGLAIVALAGCKQATAVGAGGGCRLAPVVLQGLMDSIPVGAQAHLTIGYPCGTPSSLFADWAVADTSIATIEATSDTTAVLLGRSVGQTSFTLDVPRSQISGGIRVVAAH
jgi:Pilus formation protein N terminal region